NEAYYVLEGEFEFVCGEDRVTGGPGTFVYATRGVPHRYRNVGPSTGRLLFHVHPRRDRSFLHRARKRTEPHPRTAQRDHARARNHARARTRLSEADAA
ncbi:MAG: cupin domain-containing protein, partial [Vulcanimicrobiaceae bacterium]